VEVEPMSNPLGIKGVDHIHFYVDDANKWAAYYVKCYGMRERAYGTPATGLVGRYSYVVGQGRVNFVFTSSAGDSSEEAKEVESHVALHGCGVKDVAFKVVNAKDALEKAKAAGAVPAKESQPTEGYTALMEHVSTYDRTAIRAYGDTIHSFIQRTERGNFAPNYTWYAGGMDDSDISFAMIDHIVANVERMDEWCDFYAKVFGFEQTAHFDINTGRSALMSKVMGEREGYIKMPINEPSSANSQIQEFLNEHKGPGVQHIALLTPDIITTVRQMRDRGVQFMDACDSYYDENFLPRVGQIRESVDDLKDLRILVDRDRPDGYLLQVFTQPLFGRPTLFHEVIQRRGNSDGFGEGNFKALFEAIEREQARRGTL
jgi:4-hydroxyphenylpyruvate dioxygenase